MLKDNYKNDLQNYFDFCFVLEAYERPKLQGKKLWTMELHNIVVNTGLQNSIDTCLLGVAAETDWYFELSGASSSFAAADTPASHAGWTENQDYDEATRQVWTGVRTAQNVTNSASPAVVTVTTGSTFGGVALVSSNIKGNNAAGIIFSGVNATEGDQVLGAAASISMVYSITAADDGA